MISFVGAGPGDFELITAKGIRRLRNADVVIYDRLASPLLLFYCKPSCRFVYVGKTPYQKTITQQKINQLLLQTQATSANVVRLKGGDPVIFGRLSEELKAVQQAGLQFEVVPGVTAASGIAAYAGVSLTERMVSSEVLFASGKKKNNKTADYSNFRPEQTICLYMGIDALPELVEALKKQGFLPNTPVRITSWGTIGFQESVTGCLASILPLVREQKIKNPAMIMVGWAVAEQKERDWFSTQPDFGEHLLIVACRRPTIAELIEYTENGAAVWWRQVGPLRDQRFDEVGAIYEAEHHFSNILFADEAAQRYYAEQGVS